jgi:plastocyanin
VRIVEDEPDGFQPGTVTIDAGQSVTFGNAHDDLHTATGGSFDTGILQPDSMATITFDEPGTFPYACMIHSELSGTVEVRGGSGTPESATPEASPASAAGGEVAVSIEKLEFIPPEIRVTAGSAVTWTNEDVMAHTATSLDGTFHTGNLAKGQSGSVTFDTPGQFDYQCAIHTGMKVHGYRRIAHPSEPPRTPPPHCGVVRSPVLYKWVLPPTGLPYPVIHVA